MMNNNSTIWLLSDYDRLTVGAYTDYLTAKSAAEDLFLELYKKLVKSHYENHYDEEYVAEKLQELYEDGSIENWVYIEEIPLNNGWINI